MSENVHVSVKLKNRNFSSKIKKFLANEKTPMKAARIILFNALRRVIDKTPVKYGQARSGWGAGADAGGLGLSYSSQEERDGRAKSKFEETKQSAHFRLVCINGVDYIEPLEHGHSGQAPYGMVRISIAEIEEEMGLGGGIPDQVKSIYQAAWAEAGLGEGTEFRAGMLVDILPAMFTDAQVKAAAGRGSANAEAEMTNRGR